MTTVTVYRSKTGVILGFTAEGHADDSLQAGEDIYCAGISAITQTACIGLEEVAKVKVKLKMRDGFLSARVSPADAAFSECRVIFETLVLGLSSLKESYPGHLQIIEEVQS